MPYNPKEKTEALNVTMPKQICVQKNSETKQMMLKHKKRRRRRRYESFGVLDPHHNNWQE